MLKSENYSSENKYKLLVVDDEKYLLEILSDFLSVDLAVTTASSGEEALELLKKEAFDIVLSDLKLSGMSGNDLLKYVNKLEPKPAFFLMSGHFSDVEELKSYVTLGVSGLINKPFDIPGDLAKVLKARLMVEPGGMDVLSSPICHAKD